MSHIFSRPITRQKAAQRPVSVPRRAPNRYRDISSLGHAKRRHHQPTWPASAEGASVSSRSAWCCCCCCCRRRPLYAGARQRGPRHPSEPISPYHGQPRGYWEVAVKATSARAGPKALPVACMCKVFSRSGGHAYDNGGGGARHRETAK